MRGRRLRGFGAPVDHNFIAHVVDQGPLTFMEVCRLVGRGPDIVKRTEKILRWCAGPRALARERYGEWFGLAHQGTYETRSRSGTSWRSAFL
jgi:hypothetical protein